MAPIRVQNRSSGGRGTGESDGSSGIGGLKLTVRGLVPFGNGAPSVLTNNMKARRGDNVRTPVGVLRKQTEQHKTGARLWMHFVSLSRRLGGLCKVSPLRAYYLNSICSALHGYFGCCCLKTGTARMDLYTEDLLPFYFVNGDLAS